MKQLIILIMLVGLFGCEREAPDYHSTSEVSVSARMGSQPDPGFKRVLAPREFHFPEDHGPHPDYATEWWYFTGNVENQEGEELGYQITLFRVGLKAGLPSKDSEWRSHQVFMGHLAVSDLSERKHHSEERFSRMNLGLAGARSTPLKVWLGEWSINGGHDKGLFPIRLTAQGENIAIDLRLTSKGKFPVLQGDRGFSRKGYGQGNASYYYSYTRLMTEGEIRIGERTERVRGNSWFDREWSSSALASDQAGWDWLALQLDDGRDLMFYRMRDHQGKAQIFSNGVLVDKLGQSVKLNLKNTNLVPTDYWPNSEGVRYPIAWQLEVPEHQLSISIRAAFEDQEMDHSVRYWEGVVKVSGTQSGVGYLEMSGY